MARKIHRDSAEARGDQPRSEEAILLTHVAQAGDADDERAGAPRVVIGDLTARQFEKLGGSGRGWLIGARRKGGGDSERRRRDEEICRCVNHHRYLTNTISLVMQGVELLFNGKDDPLSVGADESR